jgi:hypothetical protein
VSFLTSSNGGNSWRTAATIPGRRAKERIPTAVADASHWFALPDGARRVVGLVNGKAVRSAATSGLPLASPGFELEDVSFASPTTGWATVAAGHEALYRTLDGGSHWAPLDVPAGARREP